MKRRDRILVFLLISVLLTRTIKGNSSNTTKCVRSCGSGHGRGRRLSLPYPFGFSAGCEIQLRCNATGKAFVGEFPVQSVGPDSIKINIERKCNRPLRTSVGQLFGPNYAPTSRNAILLENCTEPGAACEIPTILVQTHFSSLSCSADDSSNSSSISCYSERNTSAFIDFHRLRKKKCEFLLSSISAASLNNSESPVSLEIQVAELGWWMEGGCHTQQCDPNANCTSLLTPNGSLGYRCYCKQGFEGDGFQAGIGCNKVSKCSPARYFSGKCGGTTRVVTLVGGIAAATSLMISLGLAMCCFLRRRSKMKARHFTKRRLSEATGNLNIPIYNYKEIEKATSGFSEKYRLGTGAYGTVYAGKLHGDEWVAIKRIRHRGADSIEQVVNEIKLISSVSHPNLVRLLGCSIDYGEQILVYEFMPNGTLCQHLQRERGDGLASWLIRLTIATETAQAIAYLHSAIKPPIYHRDIKSSNILLDHNFRSKVADFGLSRLGIIETSHISTAPQGTPGYLDPQYHQNFHLSDKSDVYSFGVVLVEIITGLKAVDFTRPQNEVNLASLASERIGKGCLDEIIDPFLEPRRDSWTLTTIHKVAELAFRCLAFHRDMRPSMIEVAAELEQIRKTRWTCSEQNTCTASSEVGSSSSSSSSNVSEKPISINESVLERRDHLVLVKTGDGHSFDSNKMLKANSPVSVHLAWLSEQSSPASNSLLRNSTQLSS
ncbi:wall-associated receptor kinase-like 14 [Humulus lupulus]|uniref:wall-associated receptor kinase-like 14 n=1 Tax=Humulus lupulus TaxID=3486 RepID=UPI002B4159C3|nr:wall-associated receptor kinase-like 14 [Humulus lupulus]